MLAISEDVLILILKELQNDIKSLHSCLLVDRTLCKATVPILWKNPLKFCFTNNAKNILLNVILLHLSKESRENLKNQEIDLFAENHQQPLFNYISFWRHLNLRLLEIVIDHIKIIVREKTNVDIIRNEVWKLFINKNTNFTHLFVYLHSKIHFIPEGLAKISKSIETLELSFIDLFNNNSEIIKLIEAQRYLKDVRFSYVNNEQFRKILEELLIKHSNTVQYLRISWEPITNFLTCFVNLISLDINLDHANYRNLNWSYLENVSLPVLKVLKVQRVLSKSLASLIKNTKGSLTEISINYECDNVVIQAIYQYCPKLRYIKLFLNYNHFSEFERLLTNCQYLNGLVIARCEYSCWNNLLKLLAKSSPNGLFKFKFQFDWCAIPNNECLKLFFESWKGRNPMLLQTIPVDYYSVRLDGLIEKYKTEGAIKKYDNDIFGNGFEDFEWIEKIA